MTTLTVGSLFTGIGGLDRGLERAGMTVVWQAEIDPYCCKVLARHWPHVPNLGDVTTVDWSSVPRVDVIAGGYPCQPFSLAGQRLGDRDPRHLWPHMRDAIRVLRPRYALLENVPGHLALGFGRVLGDLAEIGFDAEWDCIPAAAVGAPHLRWRVFVVAYPQRQPDHIRRTALLRGRANDTKQARVDRGDVADTSGQRCDTGRRLGRPWPTPIRSRGWDIEPDVGRVAHGIPHRVDRLRALGNAVVPQVAQHIGQLILKAAA